MVILEEDQEVAAIMVLQARADPENQQLQVVLLQNRQDLARLVVVIVPVLLAENQEEAKTASTGSGSNSRGVLFLKVMTQIQENPSFNGVRNVISQHIHHVLV